MVDGWLPAEDALEPMLREQVRRDAASITLEEMVAYAQAMCVGACQTSS